ncbi:MAG: hypothetical protein JHC31_04535 [Sulfurihydrogenibium sp.]|nr:hypothetical protein [Sulfurihydrogenibium sp.]
MNFLKILMILFIGFSISYGATDPTDQKKIIEKIEEKKQHDIDKININTNNSGLLADPNDDRIFIPKNENTTLECKMGADGHIHCQSREYKLPIFKPGIFPIEGKKEPIVPQPKQYKNVFKAIATVMYMFAFIYFLVQISMEAYRRRYLQAATLLLMFLIGTSILYIAYKAVFNAP